MHAATGFALCAAELNCLMFRVMGDMAKITNVLMQERDVRLAEAAQLDEVLALLKGITPSVRVSRKAASSGVPSVRTRVLELAEKDDRDWATNEMVAEYERRGIELNSSQPRAAVRSAIADLLAGKLIERTAPGRYRAVKWVKPSEPRTDVLAVM